MAMILRLDRYSYTSKYTEGKLYVREGVDLRRIAYTIERPWKGNARNISCIPEGTYDIRQHKRPNGDNVYMLIGNGCCAYEHQLADGGPTRWGILIHAGNYPDDVEGCIAPGLHRERGVVWQSRAAMAELHKALMPYFSMNEYGQILITSEVSVSR